MSKISGLVAFLAVIISAEMAVQQQLPSCPPIEDEVLFQFGRHSGDAELLHWKQYCETKVPIYYSFPKDIGRTLSYEANITLILVKSDAANHAPPQVLVTEGGLGSNNVTLHIFAENSDGLNFFLYIFGTKNSIPNLRTFDQN